MDSYGNVSGNSGVTAYEIGPDFIKVRFHRGGTYVYSNAAPGPAHVAHLKGLALAGQGLGTYISQHVGKAYERKES